MAKNVIIPAISVIIPTYGEVGVELTRECLRTLRATHQHLGDEHLEIIVVQDGEDQPVVEQIDSLTQEFGARLVVNVERRGFGAACNQGLVRSNGSVVFLINNDIEFDGPVLQYLADFSQAIGAGLVGCKLLYPNMQIQHAGVYYVPHPDGLGHWDHYGRGDYHLTPRWSAIARVLLTGALLGIPRSTIEAVGYLDERFKFTCEDIDYNLRVLESGRGTGYLGYVHAFHKEGATRGSDAASKQAKAPEVIQMERDSLKLLHEKWVGVDFALDFGLDSNTGSLNLE